MKSFGIIFNYSKSNSIFGNNSPKRKSLCLWNEKSLLRIFQLLPKNFTISTENGSCKFNIDMLRFSSHVISQLYQKNSNDCQYHLELSDDKNVLRKLGKLYQGEIVIIEENEILIFTQIIQKLGITSNAYLKNNPELYYDILDSPTKVIIDYQSLIDILKTNLSFTIKTNSKKYHCNPFSINLSTTIREFLASNPNSNSYTFDFPDEFDEFQSICDFFNFEEVSVSINNIDSIRQIAKDLKINIILKETETFLDVYDKFSQTLDESQKKIDKVNELFDILCKIEPNTIQNAKNFILQSKWTAKEENVRELGAFILQVIDSNLVLHQYLLDLLIHLDSESTEQNNLKILIPLIVDNLFDFFGNNIQNCSFIYLLYKKEIISKDLLFEKLRGNQYNLYVYIDRLAANRFYNDNNNPNINSGALYDYNYKTNYVDPSNEIKLIKTSTPIILWFLPEIVELNNLKSADMLQGYGSIVDSFIKKQYNQIDLYKKMRDSGEPDDEITIALRHDDIDKFQSIISAKQINVEEGTVPYNIYEEFVPNGKTIYLNYAAAYGSIKCFKYLLLNHNTVDKQTFKFAVYGGNIEIIKIVDQKYQTDDIYEEYKELQYNNMIQNNGSGRKQSSLNKCLFQQKIFDTDNNIKDVSKFIDDVVSDTSFTYSIVPSIVRHQNDLFDWILDKNLAQDSIDKDSFTDLIRISYKSGNIHSLIELFDKYFEFLKEIISNNMSNKSFIYDMIIASCQNGFFILTETIIKVLQSIIPNDKQILLYPELNLPKNFGFDDERFYDPLKIIQTVFKSKKQYPIMFGNLSILKLFIEKFNQDELENLLICSIVENYANIVKYFFENLVKKNIFKLTDNNVTLLIEYSLLSKTDYLYYYLIEQIKQINPTAIEDFSWSFLMVKNASYSNNVQLAKFITDIVFKENPKEDFIIPFINAISSNSAELCKFFIDKKVFISFYLIKKYIKTISKSNKEVFSIFMNIVPKKILNNIYSNLYISAIEVNNVYIVECLLKEMPNTYDGLFDAINVSNLEIVKMILKSNSSPKFVNKRTPQGTALCSAVRNHSFEIVKLLLSVPGIDVDLYDESGNTPLIEAFINNDLDIFNTILDFYGDDIYNKSIQLDVLMKKVSQNMKNESYNNIIDRVFEIRGIESHLIYDQSSTIFEIACLNNDVNLVSRLLNLNTIDVNVYKPKTGDTILIETIRSKNIETANLLIEYPKTDINFRNNDNQTPLIVAVTNHLDSIVELLLNDEKFDKDDSLFNYAFSISSDSTTKILLNSKYFDINYKMFTYQNQLFRNETYKPWSFYSYEHNNDTILIHAVKKQNEEIVDLIINHPDFDKKKSKLNKAIYTSVESKDITIFKKLIKKIDIDDFNNYQSKKSFFLINKIIIQRYSTSNIEGIGKKTDLSLLLEEIFGNSDLVINKKSLCYAFEDIFNHIKYLNLNIKCFSVYDLDNLIKYDRNHNNYIDVNSLLVNGKTYLTSIENSNNLELQTHLLEYGADPNISDKYEIYPLQIAFYVCNNSFIRLLIESNKIDFNKRVPDLKIKMDITEKRYGIPIKLRNYYYKNSYVSLKQINNHITYLHLAASYYDPEILKIFLDKKLIDVNVTDDLGNTPLIYACMFNKGNNVEMLFQIDDLDFLHCNNEGKDALHIFDTQFQDDDKTTKDKNEYLKKLMIHLDKDTNESEKKDVIYNLPNQESLSLSSNFEKAFNSSGLSAFSNTPNQKYSSKILNSSRLSDFINSLNSSSKTSVLQSPNLTGASNSSNQTSAFKISNSSGLSDFISQSNSSNQANALQSPNLTGTSNSSSQANISASIQEEMLNSSNFGSTLGHSIQSNTNNRSSLIGNFPEAKQPSNSYNLGHNYSLQKAKGIDDEAIESPSSNESKINCPSLAKRYKKLSRKYDVITANYDGNLYQQMPESSYACTEQFAPNDYQSFVAHQQIDQLLLISQSNQIRFNQQMMKQANLNLSLKHHRPKRTKKPKHE